MKYNNCYLFIPYYLISVTKEVKNWVISCDCKLNKRSKIILQQCQSSAPSASLKRWDVSQQILYYPSTKCMTWLVKYSQTCLDLWRPKPPRVEEHENMLQNIKKGLWDSLHTSPNKYQTNKLDKDILTGGRWSCDVSIMHQIIATAASKRGITCTYNPCVLVWNVP